MYGDPVILKPECGVRVLSYWTFGTGALLSAILYAFWQTVAPGDANDAVIRLMSVFLAFALVPFLICLVWLTVALRRRARSNPQVTFDHTGFQIADSYWADVPWAKVEAIESDIDGAGFSYKKASAWLHLSEGHKVYIDLLPLTGDHRNTLLAARRLLYDSKAGNQRGVEPLLAELKCPHCGVSTSSLKQIDVGVLLFLVFFVKWHLSKVNGCRRCVTKSLIFNGLINLISANVVWPIWFVVVAVPQIWTVSRDGHDIAVFDKMK